METLKPEIIELLKNGKYLKFGDYKVERAYRFCMIDGEAKKTYLANEYYYTYKNGDPSYSAPADEIAEEINFLYSDLSAGEEKEHCNMWF